MVKRGRDQFQAKVTDDAGITRAKVPSPLIRDMGARPGDFMIFRRDETGNILMTLSRSKGSAKRSAGAKSQGSRKGTRAARGGSNR